LCDVCARRSCDRRMLRRDGEVFLLGTAMAGLFSIRPSRNRHGQRLASVRTGGQSKARSKRESAAGFKREKRTFSAIQPPPLRLFSAAKGLDGASMASPGGAKATPSLRL